MVDVAPGKEEEFRYLERALALSDWLDRLIEATEPICQPEAGAIVLAAAPNLLSVSSRQRDSGRDTVWDRIYVSQKPRELEQERLVRRLLLVEPRSTPCNAECASRPRGFRAGFASRLTRLALALHREAATETALQPRTESSS